MVVAGPAAAAITSSYAKTTCTERNSWTGIACQVCPLVKCKKGLAVHMRLAYLFLKLAIIHGRASGFCRCSICAGGSFTSAGQLYSQVGWVRLVATKPGMNSNVSAFVVSGSAAEWSPVRSGCANFRPHRRRSLTALASLGFFGFVSTTR
jgi:hypothetical protein